MKHLPTVIAMGALFMSVPASGAENLGLQDRVSTTGLVDIAPGGLIRINGSFGVLNVEAWDRAQVEVIVTRSLPLHFGVSKTPDRDKSRLESIQIKAERVSPTELAVTTTLASRNGSWAPPLSNKTTNGVTADYEIHVPRDSRLAIQHGVGFVQVTGVTGDIDVNAKRGDILLWLPPAPYSIDAKTKFGPVSSELDGATVSQYVIGQRFTGASPAPAHQLHLRLGFGGITIRNTLPESDPPANINGR